VEQRNHYIVQSILSNSVNGFVAIATLTGERKVAQLPIAAF